LCKKYGSSAKFAATTILGAVVPGSPAVISLVEQAFDAAQKSGQDDWEINVANQLQTTADNQVRLEQVLDVLGSELQHVFAQMASLQQMPEVARQMLEVARANDARCQEAARKLDGIAHRFDRLEKQNNQLLAGQLRATGVLEEMLPAVRRLANAPVQAPSAPSPAEAQVSKSLSG
jgi:GTP1/Obg family GTP-binding protein